MSDGEQPAAHDSSPDAGASEDWKQTRPGQQRRFQRAAVDMVVRLRFGNVQQFLDATAEDLSVGGIFLRSEHALPGGQLRQVGQLIALEFDAGARRVVEGIGKIVRVVTPESPGAIPGVGIEFVELNERSRELIEAIVAIKLAPTGSG
jgi:molecular chaperone DnaK